MSAAPAGVCACPREPSRTVPAYDVIASLSVHLVYFQGWRQSGEQRSSPSVLGLTVQSVVSRAVAVYCFFILCLFFLARSGSQS